MFSVNSASSVTAGVLTALGEAACSSVGVWDAAHEILSFPLPLLAVLFGKYVRTERYVTWSMFGPLA